MTDAALPATSDADRRAGFIAAALAYISWGFLPLYLKLIGFADVRERRMDWTREVRASQVRIAPSPRTSTAGMTHLGSRRFGDEASRPGPAGAVSSARDASVSFVS